MKKEPLKDIDSAARSRFLKVISYTFPPLGILGLVVGVKIFKSFKLGLIFGGTAGILASLACHFIIERLGSGVGNLIYGKRRPIYSEFEKHEGPLNQARYLKQKSDFFKAQSLVDDILTKAPNLPEALYLKAQICWEGYGDAAASRKYLRQILILLPDKNETYHRWASSLLDHINSE
jgi:hypothetical protein